jgi:cell wall-associated NlpC family hydrolase
MHARAPVEVSREEIVEAAREALGWPYLHKGKGPKGIDCIGLIHYVSERTGVISNLRQSFIDTFFGDRKYPFEASPQFAHAWRKLVLKELGLSFQRNQEVRSPHLGDVVFCRSKTWTHLGIIGSDKRGLTMIHPFAQPKIYKVVEQSYVGQWKEITVASFAFPGVV